MARSLPFYVTSTLVHSSFDHHKAKRMTASAGGSIATLRIPTVACDALWSFVPAGVRPYWLKIDIEERHCAPPCYVAALALRPSNRPSDLQYIEASRL